MRNDEQRVLPGADQDDAGGNDEGLRPEGQRSGSGERNNDGVRENGKRCPPCRAARQLQDQLLGQRLAEVVLEFLAVQRVSPKEEILPLRHG
jgi:hypothetical protein